MMPTALSAQVGGAVNAGGAVRGAVVRGIPGPDLGTWRSPSEEVHRTRKRSKAARHKAAPISAMGNLLFWVGLGVLQKEGILSKRRKRCFAPILRRAA